MPESFPLLVALKDACPAQACVPRYAQIGEQYAGVQMCPCSPGSSHFCSTRFLVNTFDPVASNIHYVMKNSHLGGKSMPFCYYNQLLMRKFHLEVPQVPHSGMYNVSYINSLSPPPKTHCACDSWHCHHSANHLTITSNQGTNPRDMNNIIL